MDSPAGASTRVHVVPAPGSDQAAVVQVWRRVTIPSKTRRKRSFWRKSPHLRHCSIGELPANLLVGSELGTPRRVYGGEAAVKAPIATAWG